MLYAGKTVDDRKPRCLKCIEAKVGNDFLEVGRISSKETIMNNVHSNVVEDMPVITCQDCGKTFCETFDSIYCEQLDIQDMLKHNLKVFHFINAMKNAPTGIHNEDYTEFKESLRAYSLAAHKEIIRRCVH